MPALKLDMTIPLGDAGHVHLAIDITDLDALTTDQRTILADTGAEFYTFAASTLAPAATLPGKPEAEIYDPNKGLLAGVTGSRRNET